VRDFTVAIYGSIESGTEPDVVSPPLISYQTGGNAGQAPAGTYGGTAMYDYHFALPMPFEASAGTKYWLQIEASQNAEPDWGISAGTGGDGQHYRKIASPGSVYYRAALGDAAFTLLGVAPAGVGARVSGLLARLGLPVRLSEPLDPERIVGAMASDKKNRSARVRFALPSRLGDMDAPGGWTQEAPGPALRQALQIIAWHGPRA
jgi:hypothetical protein